MEKQKSALPGLLPAPTASYTKTLENTNFPNALKGGDVKAGNGELDL